MTYKMIADFSVLSIAWKGCVLPEGQLKGSEN